MNNPTSTDISRAVENLVRTGHLIAYRDGTGVIRFATPTFAAAHHLTHRALPINEVQRHLAAHQAEKMGEWN